MKILYLTHRLPYAPNRGDRIRAFHMLREMSRFAEVTLFSFVHSSDEEEHARNTPFARRVVVSRVPRLRNLARCATALPTARPLTHVLLEAPDVRAKLSSVLDDSRPDLVVAYCSGMARLAMEPPLTSFPFVLDMVDVDSAKWARLGAERRGAQAWVYRRESHVLRTFEADAARRATATLVVNDRERDLMRQIAPTAGVSVIPNGVDIEAFRPPAGPGISATVVFCGVMNYPPNEEGVLGFVRDVWPIVRARRPDAQFVVVGSNPGSTLRRLADNDPSIRVTGAVPEVQPYLWDAAVSVAPLQVAHGVQNKVLEALAAGLPAVVTPAVADGLPAEALSGCEVAENPVSFAEAVLAMIGARPEVRRQRALSAEVADLAWPRRLQPLEKVLTDSVVAGRRASTPSSSQFPAYSASQL